MLRILNVQLFLFSKNHSSNYFYVHVFPFIIDSALPVNDIFFLHRCRIYVTMKCLKSFIHEEDIRFFVLENLNRFCKLKVKLFNYSWSIIIIEK